jgi:hypothetical protein
MNYSQKIKNYNCFRIKTKLNYRVSKSNKINWVLITIEMKKLRKELIFLTVRYLMLIRSIFYVDMKILMIKSYLLKIILKLYRWKAKLKKLLSWYKKLKKDRLSNMTQIALVIIRKSNVILLHIKKSKFKMKVIHFYKKKLTTYNSSKT